jgi:hypothetical protein
MTITDTLNTHWLRIPEPTKVALSMAGFFFATLFGLAMILLVGLFANKANAAVSESLFTPGDHAAFSAPAPKGDNVLTVEVCLVSKVTALGNLTWFCQVIHLEPQGVFKLVTTRFALSFHYLYPLHDEKKSALEFTATHNDENNDFILSSCKGRISLLGQEGTLPLAKECFIRWRTNSDT